MVASQQSTGPSDTSILPRISSATKDGSENKYKTCVEFTCSLCEVIKGTNSVADRKRGPSSKWIWGCALKEKKRIRTSYLLRDRSGIAVPTSMVLLLTLYYLWNYSEYSQAEISLAFVSWFIEIKLKKRQSVGWSLLVIDIWRFDINGGLDGSGERTRASIWTSFSAEGKVNRGGVDIRNESNINWREDIVGDLSHVGVPLWESLNTLVGRGLCVFGLLWGYETLEVFKPPVKMKQSLPGIPYVAWRPPEYPNGWTHFRTQATTESNGGCPKTLNKHPAVRLHEGWVVETDVAREVVVWGPPSGSLERATDTFRTLCQHSQAT